VKLKIIFGSLLVWFFLQASNALAMPGFIKYKIKPSDTYSKICKKKLHYFNTELLNLLIKINRTDAGHLVPGYTIYLPLDIELARAYCPLPKFFEPLNKYPRCIHVNLLKQYFGAYEFGSLKFWGPISSGKKGEETPTGKFMVLEKKIDKISSICGKTMYYSLKFFGGYFMHHQSLNGKPNSIGCVRTLLGDAKKLFYWIKIKDPIIVHKDTLAALK